MNKTLYFTTSYVRELPYVNRLFDSFNKYIRNARFKVILIDNAANIPEEFDFAYEVISMDDINVGMMSELSNRYDWNELKNNCKPFIFSHLLKENEQVVYVDCTTIFHQKTDLFDEVLATHNAFVVPQLLFAHQHPKENDALNLGIFHNGCMGFNSSEITAKWMAWWQNHARFNGYVEPCRGMNTDRLCLEFAPIFFENTHVLKHAGVNVGEWNKPERRKMPREEIISTNYADLPKSKLLSVIPEYGIPVPELSFSQKYISPILQKAVQKIDDFFNQYYVYAQD